MSANEEKNLKYQVGLSMRRYFKNLDGNKPKDVFEMVMKEVETVVRRSNDSLQR